MALGTKVVDLIRLNLLDDPDQVAAIGEVSVVQNQSRVLFVRVLVEVIDATGVEAAGTSLDAMDLIPLFQEELSQVAAVLASDASDQSDLGHGGKALSYAVYGAKCPSLESTG